MGDTHQAEELLRRGDLLAAECLYRKIIASGPTDVGTAYNFGHSLALQGRFSEARSILEQCFRHAPDHQDVPLRLGTLRLATGDYAGGWPLYELRIGRPGFNTERPALPAWRGEELAGKTIVVWREQGFGDVIQCLRFLPRLRDLGARVWVVTVKELVRLVQGMGFEAFPIVGAEVNLPAMPDFYVHPFSLPGRLGMSLETLPAAPYVKATPRNVGARIGIAWRGRPAHPNDHHRSMPDSLAARLRDLPGAVELTAEALGAGDFRDTAEVIAGLDAVVTVDTAVAHLAGAMGKPVWLMLSAWGSDWRWMEGRADSPWYPATRIVRQQKPGDWFGVLDRVTAALGADGFA